MKNFYKKSLSLLAYISFASLCFAGSAKVLLITGSNNHDWETTSRFMESLLKSNGFECIVCKDPSKISEKDFEDISMVILHWNSWGEDSEQKRMQKESTFPLSARKAFIKAVENGCGVLTIHAGASAEFNDTPQYKLVTLADWDLKKTKHGNLHEFEVSKKVNHQSVKNLPDKMRTFDELWEFPRITNSNAIVVLESESYDGRKHPCVLVADFGKGRCAEILLGHSVDCMKTQSFKDIFLEMVKWCSKISSNNK